MGVEEVELSPISDGVATSILEEKELSSIDGKGMYVIEAVLSNACLSMVDKCEFIYSLISKVGL